MADIPRTKKPEPGSHREDVVITTDLLEEVRRKGLVHLPNTLDGDIDIFFNKGKRNYSINQTYNGQTVSFTDVLRHKAQSYLIELRERRRAEDKKQRKSKKEKETA